MLVAKQLTVKYILFECMQALPLSVRPTHVHMTLYVKQVT